jgi:predicted transcriptional regulator YdeE
MRFMGAEGESLRAVARAPAPLAVYCDYASDHRGEYRFVLGVEPKEGSELPAGAVRIEVPAGRFEVFVVEGAMPAALIQGWRAIWRHYDEAGARRRLFRHDFERHLAPDRVEIYIGVEN